MVSGVKVSKKADKVTQIEAELQDKIKIQAEITETEAIQSVVTQVAIKAATS